MTTPFWVTAFLDLPAAKYDAGVAFWRAVTGYGLSTSRGPEGEFATMLPPDGDAYLRVQRLGAGTCRIHLDLHVDDVDHVDVHTSPGGFTFCRVGVERAGAVPRPAAWPGGRSRVDQVCLDIPASLYEAECAFWAEATGWTPSPVDAHDEFRRLDGVGMPLRMLLQRLDDDSGEVRAHLDLAADDPPAEVARQVALGASYVRPGRGWTVLTDPTGREYCITARAPRDGAWAPILDSGSRPAPFT